MKDNGYIIDSGYKGCVDNGYPLFSTEKDYDEYENKGERDVYASILRHCCKPNERHISSVNTH